MLFAAAVHAVALTLPAPPGPELAAQLLAWESYAAEVKTVRADLTLTRRPLVGPPTRERIGCVLHAVPDRTVLRIEPAGGDKRDYEAYISDGRAVYHYSGLDKIVTEFDLQQIKKAEGLAHLFLDGLTGVATGEGHPALAVLYATSPSALAERYHIMLYKADDSGVYVDLRPRTADDRKRFVSARVSLHGPGVAKPFRPYTPALVAVEKRNGDTEVWEFKGVLFNTTGYGNRDFAYVPVPGWAVRRAGEFPAAKP